MFYNQVFTRILKWLLNVRYYCLTGVVICYDPEVSSDKHTKCETSRVFLRSRAANLEKIIKFPGKAKYPRG